jgi:putative oxidoreductase
MTTTDVRKPLGDTAVDRGLSTGLLILRIGLGAAVVQAGLIKAFDFGATVQFMEAGGWRLAMVGALMVTAAETLGGIGLILGAATPLACFAVIAAMVDAWAVNVSTSAFWSQPFNVPFLLALGAAAILFAGPGAYSVDSKIVGRTQWSMKIAVGLLVLAFAVAILTWVALLGTNPIHFSAPTS